MVYIMVYIKFPHRYVGVGAPDPCPQPRPAADTRMSTAHSDDATTATSYDNTLADPNHHAQRVDASTAAGRDANTPPPTHMTDRNDTAPRRHRPQRRRWPPTGSTLGYRHGRRTGERTGERTAHPAGAPHPHDPAHAAGSSSSASAYMSSLGRASTGPPPYMPTKRSHTVRLTPR